MFLTRQQNFFENRRLCGEKHHNIAMQYGGMTRTLKEILMSLRLERLRAAMTVDIYINGCEVGTNLRGYSR